MLGGLACRLLAGVSKWRFSLFAQRAQIVWEFMNTEALIRDFCQIAPLAEFSIVPAKIIVFRPDDPRKIPKGYAACYVFHCENHCFKVGRASPNAMSRYMSHPFSKNAPSTLAKSIFQHRRALAKKIPSLCEEILRLTDEKSAGNWIKNNCRRHIFLFERRYYPFPVALFESFLHCRLNPWFEGKVTIFDRQDSEEPPGPP
jgi:hypothetical protein